MEFKLCSCSCTTSCKHNSLKFIRKPNLLLFVFRIRIGTWDALLQKTRKRIEKVSTKSEYSLKYVYFYFYFRFYILQSTTWKQSFIKSTLHFAFPTIYTHTHAYCTVHSAQGNYKKHGIVRSQNMWSTGHWAWHFFLLSIFIIKKLRISHTPGKLEIFNTKSYIYLITHYNTKQENRDSRI